MKYVLASLLALFVTVQVDAAPRNKAAQQQYNAALQAQRQYNQALLQEQRQYQQFILALQRQNQRQYLKMRQEALQQQYLAWRLLNYGY